MFAAFEEYAVYVVVAGLLFFAIGWLALIFTALRVSKRWGVGVLFFPPLALVFIPKHLSVARRPTLLILLGLMVGLSPMLVGRLSSYFIDLGPYERMVNGELHLTLTGWDRKEYSVLQARPQTVVLQMANPDVTDSTLEWLLPMQGLRELDLNHTAVTDAGLARLEALTKLEVLRLRNTKVTDAGMHQLLAKLENLRELDVRGTAIAPETIKTWRQAKPGRRAMVDRPTSSPSQSTQQSTQPTAPSPTRPSE